MTTSKLNPRSADFQANAAAMQALVDDLRAQCEKIAQGGGEAARAKHLGRGKLLPRDRVQQLLDPGTPFLEIAPLAAMNMSLPLWAARTALGYAAAGGRGAHADRRRHARRGAARSRRTGARCRSHRSPDRSRAATRRRSPGCTSPAAPGRPRHRSRRRGRRATRRTRGRPSRRPDGRRSHRS